MQSPGVTPGPKPTGVVILQPAELLAALDPVGQLVAAAKKFREATPPRAQNLMRAMGAFRKAQHAPDDSV
jgi:hypothetical protein